jgi:hypothetical protein
MMALWLILKGSRLLQIGLLVVACWTVWETNNLYQRNLGASRLAAKIEKKADENATTADAVRTDVAAGKRGVRNPYRRPGD